MRRLVLLSALLLPAGATAADAAKPAARPIPPLTNPLGAKRDPVTGRSCARPSVHQAAPLGTPLSNKLGELPPGNLALAVYREVGGCQTPVIVRYGIGAGGDGDTMTTRTVPLRSKQR